ncbi:MAG: hypothetical protein IKZ21_07175, partial [Clostridia bacterium]|nr:hypothetical protein [Clostridia bacterium]
EWHPSGLDMDIYFTNRERTDLKNIASLSVWMNHMKEGEEYAVTIGEVTAFPIAQNPLNDLTVTVNGINYPLGGSLPVNAYLELEGGSWYAYDQDGNRLEDIMFPMLPDCIPAGSVITARASGIYGLELTVGSTPV